MTSPFDYIKSVNEKTPHLIKTALEEKEYIPFVVNKGLSFMPECIYHANLMNQFYGLDKLLQYDFYYTSIKKGKRFSKWLKAEPDADIIQIVQKYFNINKQTAKQYLTMLSEADIETIMNKMNEGGKNAK